MNEEPKLSLREMLKQGAPSAPVAVVTKPAAKKKAMVIYGATLRALGGAAGTDRDGVVTNPSADQRSVAGMLAGISPRRPGV